MSSSLAEMGPAANAATAPKQVESRSLRIGILPAINARVADAEAHGSAPNRREKASRQCHSVAKQTLQTTDDGVARIPDN
jgi:hypothetical protein